ncbi:sodium:proton antiporter [Clostridium sp. PL3]|uniref:Sodium:proton antiporter n=1 Tax=Clostridium thailandense TaxID=2794346 RepID=A0A949THW9_9CLOT|nr:sodium:proton antiporter [Clostridium thailandense]MBV7272550.1 sodium:proton antiporter [Clostridium thailandense]
MEGNTIILTEDLMKMLSIIIFTGIICVKLSSKIRLPDVILFILAGIVLGPQVLNVINFQEYPVANQLILTFGAAYILYDGGREVELRILNRIKVSVILLATLGVVIASFIIGFSASKILNIDFIYALLMGSVIVSTDPSVLVPLFKNMGISNKLKQTIISESACNDAAAAIMTFSILGIIAGGKFSIGASVFELLTKAGGGVIVGLIIGYISTSLVSERRRGILSGYPGEISVASVLGAYILAEHFHFSGFMAVFIVGIICGNKEIFNLHVDKSHQEIHISFKEVTIMILRIMIFVLLGTQMNFAILAQYWLKATIIIIILMFIARPASVLPSVILDKKAKWNYREIIYLMWTKETGVIPAALAGMLVSMKIPNAELISAVTFMAIILTLLLQASTAVLLARKLKLDE